MKFILLSVQVLTFNGMSVKNLKSLASMVENCDDEYLKFGLEYNQVLSLFLSLMHTYAWIMHACSAIFLRWLNCILPAQMVVLQTKTARAATLDILMTHCISSAMSDDLMSKENSLEEVQSTLDDPKTRDNNFRGSTRD